MGKESDLYNPYNTKTLGGDTRLDLSTYENVQDSINVEKVNRKLLELTDLIGRVTNNRSSSGPIPDSGVIESATITGSGSGGKQSLVTAKKGQVVDICAMDATWNTSPGATVTFGFYVHNDETDVEILMGTAASSSTNPGLDVNDFLNAPFYLTYPFSLRATVSTMGSASSVVMNTYHVRVR